MARVKVDRWSRLVLAALLVNALVGCARQSAAADGDPAAIDPATVRGPADVVVPDLIGRPVATIEKVLNAAGLVPVVRGEGAARPAEGTVLATDPAPGTVLPAGSVVTVTVRGTAPGWPPSATEREGAPNLLGHLIERYPDTFLGLGFDRAPDPIVVFNPGVDIGSWRARLDEAAEGQPYRVRSCARSRVELEQIKVLVQRWAWTSRPAGGAFGLDVDPATCSVRISGDWFTAADEQHLADRFGTAVTVAHGAAGRAVGG
jgi:hypothetical protein